MKRNSDNVNIYIYFGTREEYDKFCEKWNKTTSILKQVYKKYNENSKDRMVKQNRTASGKTFNGGK